MSKVHIFGNNIDTDVIIPARHLTTSDPEKLAKFCMEDADRDFAKNVQKGDVIVAGRNFGCGSSREHAPLAIKGAGVSCVIATSFARIFLRNAINVGLTVIEADLSPLNLNAGDNLEIDIEKGVLELKRTGQKIEFKAFPPFIKNIIEAGGLMAYHGKSVKEEVRV